jgi:hypothetical protein
LLISRKQGMLAFGLIMVVTFAGCATPQLNTFKKRAAQGDYEWIAAQKVNCLRSSDDCGRRYLIKGDACFRLAKAGTMAADNYTCAAGALAQGLALKQSWSDTATQRQFQENLCESLINLQVLQAGQAAEKTLVRLTRAAEGLYRMAPGSVPAVYYLAKARLHQIEPVLSNMNPTDRVPVCNRLKRTLTGVLSMMERAKQTPIPDWNRFAANYQRLSFDLGSAIRMAECR